MMAFHVEVVAETQFLASAMHNLFFGFDVYLLRLNTFPCLLTYSLRITHQEEERDGDFSWRGSRRSAIFDICNA